MDVSEISEHKQGGRTLQRFSLAKDSPLTETALADAIATINQLMRRHGVQNGVESRLGPVQKL